MANFPSIALLCTILLGALHVHSTQPPPPNTCSARDIFNPPPPPAISAAFAPATIRLLYDINPHEGFNLRRDVFVRLAVFVRWARHTQPGWRGLKLVLPPFRRLQHWRRDDTASHFWNEYFDLKSLRSYADVLDAWQFYDEQRLPPHHRRVHYVELTNYDLTDGRFADRYEFTEHPQIHPQADRIPPPIFGQHNYTLGSAHRARFQGSVRGVQSMLRTLWHRLGEPVGGEFTVYLQNAEIVLHDRFGDAEYWRARRSMRFADGLERIAEKFRRDRMGMEGGRLADGVQRPERWQDEKEMRSARGAPFVCAHLRRRDFVWSGRVEQVPTMRLAAEQLRLATELLGVRDIFLASDCDGTEFHDLRRHLPRLRVHRFGAADARGLADGAQAIVDQIICSRARHFVGTFESTFTYRIQEEREILGFAAASTFNTFCGRKAMAEGGGDKCERNSRWLIEFGGDEGDEGEVNETDNGEYSGYDSSHGTV